MKKIILIALLFASAAACGISPAEKHATQTQGKINLSATQTASAQMIYPCKGSEVVRMVWDTSGNSDVRFVMDRDGDSYRLHVERYNNEELDQDISFDDANPDVKHLIDTIFATPNYLIRYGSYLMTGVDTTITVICADNQDISYAHIYAWDGTYAANAPLDGIYLLIEQALHAAEPTP